MSFLPKFIKTLLANFSSRRFIVAVIAFTVERWDYWANVASIYSFTASGEAQLSAFISLNQQHRYLLGAIVLFYMGLQTVSNSSFTAANSLQNLITSATTYGKTEHKETHEDIQRVIRANEEKHLNDPSYAPIKKDTEEKFR